jgi:hypothetical protein
VKSFEEEDSEEDFTLRWADTAVERRAVRVRRIVCGNILLVCYLCEGVRSVGVVVSGSLEVGQVKGEVELSRATG